MTAQQIDFVVQYFLNNFIVFMTGIGSLILMLSTKSHFPKRVTKYSIISFATIFAYSLLTYIEYYCGKAPRTWHSLVVWRRALSVICYGLRPCMIVFPTLALKEYRRKMHVVLTVPVIVNFLVYLTGLWCDLAFWIDEENQFYGGPLHYFVFIVCGLYIINLIEIVIREYKKGKRREASCLLFVITCCVLAAAVDAFYSQNFMNNALVIACLFYYLYINIEYARKYEVKLIQSQKNELMLSQIQPHFMYNILTSIYYLCDRDTKRAKEAINSFSIYLRNNLDTIRGPQIVSFKDELSYCKNYLYLEKIRFEEELSYEFQIETMDFELPKFTLQPLVENAVKHGVSQKEGGGTVQIYSKIDGDYIIVGVKDDGVGFDPLVKKEDGRSHTGMENVNYRIKEYIHEDMHIESSIGNGCHIWFRIKKSD